MYDTPDRSTRSSLLLRRLRRPGRAVLLPALLLALLALLPGGLHGQEGTEEAEPPPAGTAPAETAETAEPEAVDEGAPEPPAAPLAPEEDALRRRVESRYEVLPVRGGLLLRPFEEYRGMRTIEITGSELAVNGREVAADELRAWMGERAEPVLALAALDPDERLRLFEVAEPPAVAAEEDAAEARAGEDDADADGATVTVAEVRTERRRSTVHRGSPAVVGASVRIAADETADDVVVVFGSAEIDGRVDGDVTAVVSPLQIEGVVERDVTAIASDVHLGEDAEIGGGVTAVGGRVHREPGARVRGGIQEIRHGFGRNAPIWSSWRWQGWDGPRFSPWDWMGSLVWPLVELLFLAFLVLFLLAVARPTVERIGTRAGSGPVKAGAVGLLTALLIFPAFLVVSVLLGVSIIGIPILVVLVLLFTFAGIPALLIAALVGYSGVAWRIGRWSEGRFGWRLESAIMAAIVGLLFLHGLDLLGHALDFGPLRIFGTMFWVAAAIVQFIAWCVGFGAVVLDLYDRRSRRRAAVTAPPAPAPPPPAPPA